ncbi:MAG: HNH endonuclease signature motif containing protein [Stackebrandtia sp.]
MERPNRPATPEFLKQAVYSVFGAKCLRCAEPRPLKAAHIVDWPDTWQYVRDSFPPYAPLDWFDEAKSVFHRIDNMIPLCSNCHDLYDDKQYEDVTEEEIRGYRDEAVKRPEVLLSLVKYVKDELSGRPRCSHKEDGKPKHSISVDPLAALIPLHWIQQGIKAGAISPDPELKIRTGTSRSYYVQTVRLDHASITN